ncbi:response regulator receiver modulated diguanylate cyclase [Fluviicoccus keumensis]|uniref:diguanylate cyclase n=1 Tax=Fluviicoccus keumensis TaxID=1435465 RepID=A0A4Q7ZBY0_9GAMM|nr:diguanylate cyclase [Fluviicoccus keumensis]RZU47674.1 response regulator receiver modulated diguanylate cyclase [Fluviicoccus keumensis]
MAEQGRPDKPARLRALQQAYGEELPKRLGELRILGDTLSPENLETLLRRVHTLAGSAGTFGYARLGAEARRLEEQLARVTAAGLQAADFVSTLHERLDMLEEASREEPEPYQPPAVPAAPGASPGERLVYIVEDDPLLAAEMAAQMGIYGWHTLVFHDAVSAQAALERQQSSALIVDIMLPEGSMAGMTLIHPSGSKIPTIVVSSRWDWESRLSAVRAKADAYLPKPVDYVALNERLDALTHHTQHPPFEVLIIEDSALLAGHYALVLRTAGMRVETLEDPTRVLETLEHFSPDLILLDLYMPACNGREVAQVIRHDSRFADLPIIFLSTETARLQQLAALHTGADDFLQKPISDPELISAVSLRAARFRGLRELIRQDRMTGLLNHIAFRLQLEFEMARQLRTGGPLSVVMLDIDHFKRVNDTHGHPVGDRVIRSLARLLTQRLRKTDIVGRYGGEEFGVIMPDTAAADAWAVMDRLREEFTQLMHNGAGTEFHCSFSAGIATLTGGDNSPETMLKLADDALYASKRQGRNRVTLNTGP